MTVHGANVGTRVRTVVAMERAHPVHPAHDSTARAVGAVGFAAVALIHVLDLQSKFHETPYLGVAYLALIVGMFYAAFELIRGNTRRGWLVGGGIAALTLVGYAVNRVWGLPGAMDDVGNWLEPLGLASLFVEGAVALLAAWALSARPSVTDGRAVLQRGVGEAELVVFGDDDLAGVGPAGRA